ncbi:MAG: hypothetical protein M0P73_01695 [Syntrophobacterales bacterium]|nr:hypothetical protein [Syntrophobacterales bacterium]
MTQTQLTETKVDLETLGVWLELEAPASQKLRRLPVTVLTLAGEIVTLEINHPWLRLPEDSLKGLKGRLRLETGEANESRQFDGVVTSAMFSAESQAKPTLGLKLANPSPDCRKVLEDLMSHATGDLRDLWDRWDEAHLNPRSGLSPNKLYGWVLAAVLSGWFLSLVSGPFLQRLGNGIVCLSSLVGAAYCVKSLYQKRQLARQG